MADLGDCVPEDDGIGSADALGNILVTALVGLWLSLLGDVGVEGGAVLDGDDPFPAADINNSIFLLYPNKNTDQTLF